MIVCHCAVVSDRTVARVVEAGARSLAEVCRSTGAGQNCGTCIFSVRRLLCQHEATVPPVPAVSPEVAVAAS